MKLIRKNLEKDGRGSVTLLPEVPEDMVPSPFDAYFSWC